FAWRGFECATHGFGHLRAGEDVALRRPGLALLVAGPTGSVGAGVRRDVSVGGHDGDLTTVFSFEGVFGEQLFRNIGRAQAWPQEIDAFLTVPDVDICLGSDGTNIRERPRHDGAHRKIAGSDGDSEITVRGIDGDDGKRGDRRRLERRTFVAVTRRPGSEEPQ